MTSKLLASAACMTFSLWAVGAQAQAPAAAAGVQAAAQAAEAAAPPIAGVCVYSEDVVEGNSLVGKVVGTRLQQLGAQVNAELGDLRTKLDADEKQAQATAATMTPDALNQARNSLGQREQQFEQLTQIRQREMDLTRQSELQQIRQALNPLVVDAFTAHKCSIFIDGNSVALVSAGMELNTDLTGRLDSKLQTLTFDLMKIPEDGGAAPVAAAAPARAPAAAAPAAKAPAKAPAAKAPATRK